MVGARLTGRSRVMRWGGPPGLRGRCVPDRAVRVHHETQDPCARGLHGDGASDRLAGGFVAHDRTPCGDAGGASLGRDRQSVQSKVVSDVIDAVYHRRMLHAQIEGFVAVAREGNVRRAAERLYLSQPALTARIQGLEAHLKAPLFRRTRTGMVLTHAGRAFLPYAERSLEALRGGAALVSELAEGVTGELVIGSAPAVSAYVLPELLARYSARHPDVRLLVRTHHSEELVAMVTRGDIHLAVVRELRDARVRMRPLFEDELVLVARPDHPFALVGAVDIDAIHRAQLILFDRTSSYYDLTQALFRSMGVVPRGVMELDNIEAAKRMVERGLGVALLPGTAVAGSLQAGSLREVRLVDAPPIRRRMVLIERGRGLQPETVAPFVALLDRIPELIPRAQAVVG